MDEVLSIAEMSFSWTLDETNSTLFDVSGTRQMFSLSIGRSLASSEGVALIREFLYEKA